MAAGPGGSGLSRRTVLRGAGGIAFIGASLASLNLFGVPDARQNPMDCRATDLSKTQKKLIVCNWPAYIDPRSKKSTSTLQVFEQPTGISVAYTDDVSDNAEFFAKVRNQLGACQPIGRDMMILTDWMAARMIGLGWVQPFDASQGPQPAPEPDQAAAATAPGTRTATTRALAERSDRHRLQLQAHRQGRVLRGADHPRRPQGQITLLSEMRDTMGFMLKVVGSQPGASSPTAEWDKAIEPLRQGRQATARCAPSPATSTSRTSTAGNIVACEAWSGDVIQAQFDNPNIKWVVPTEGVALWADNMLMPNQATHQLNAEKWIDYYYEPEVAAKLAAWVNYICPVEGAQQAMEKIDKTLVDNPLIFPQRRTTSRTRSTSWR